MTIQAAYLVFPDLFRTASANATDDASRQQNAITKYT